MLYPLISIKIIKHFNYKSRFNVVFTGGNLPRLKDVVYFINLDDKQRKETH